MLNLRKSDCSYLDQYAGEAILKAFELQIQCFDQENALRIFTNFNQMSVLDKIDFHIHTDAIAPSVAASYEDAKERNTGPTALRALELVVCFPSVLADKFCEAVERCKAHLDSGEYPISLAEIKESLDKLQIA